MSDPVTLTYPVPASLPRTFVDRALAELGLTAAALLRVKAVTIGWGGVRVEILAETPAGRPVRTVDGTEHAVDAVTIPIVEG